MTHSLYFGWHDCQVQIGFAPLVTYSATFGYLCDVYVLEEYRHTGLELWLIECCPGFGG